MKTEKHYLLETDFIISYLNYCGEKLKSDLIKFLTEGKCFTTVLNASELYFFAKDKQQLEAVNKFLYSISVLGIHSRYALRVNEFAKYFNNTRDCMFYLVALFNNLSIITSRKNIFPQGDVEIILV